ncbi:hypothetical protein EMN47_10765 [Prolixibacteraceae bacterium JC049]|nr:hypothetical protein [Prolixibacteraceae bacterium JC049]
MTNITTYQLTPHLAPGESVQVFDSLHLRELVNHLVRESWDELEQQEISPNLFFNRDIITNNTLIGYPLVIYHYVDGQFYLTGINEGAKAVDFIATRYKTPFEHKKILFSGFKLFKRETFSDEYSHKKYTYALQNWIPVHHRENEKFNRLNLLEKAILMQQQLEKHIKQELCKYLELNMEEVDSEITEITYKQLEPVLYKGYKFWTYDIEFKCNLQLPGFICLGNNKALGYGRVVKL